MEADDRVKRLLKEAEAVITDDHFVYKSGLHGDAYVNKDAVLKHPRIMNQLAGDIAMWAEARLDEPVHAVAGPAVAGAIFAHLVAGALGRIVEVDDDEWTLAVYADKDGDDFVFRRGYEKDIPGRNILLVEDILTTGGSVAKVVGAVRKLEGNVLGVAAICNRGNVSEHDLDVPVFHALLSVKMETYLPDICPLCKEKRPINVSIGHGRAYVAEHGQP